MNNHPLILGAVIGSTFACVAWFVAYPVWREREMQRHVDEIKQRSR